MREPVSAHAVARFRHENALRFVELINRAFVGIRELHGAADDRGEHGIKVERGVDRPQDFLQRLQLGDRL